MFQIRQYGKSELALLYFPNARTASGALNNLNYWIDGKPGLRQKIRDLGMPKKANFFIPKEVELIVNDIGEPVKDY